MVLASCESRRDAAPARFVLNSNPDPVDGFTCPDSKIMNEANSYRDSQSDVETALLDVELFLKYHAPERALKRLLGALDRNPRSIPLRERLREVAAANQHPEEAARQCLALARIYIERDDFELAHDRLLEAKQHDARISIASGLEAVRRARRPDLHQTTDALLTPAPEQRHTTLAGDISAISIFDIIQVIENSRLTGALAIIGSSYLFRLFFNGGRIVGAESDTLNNVDAFRQIIEITGGAFDFERSAHEFPVTIYANSNTSLILENQADEESVEKTETEN